MVFFYKGNHNSPPTSTLLLLTLSLFFFATVDSFPLTARIDELLLTGIRVRYWSADQTMQITEKTLPHSLLQQ